MSQEQIAELLVSLGLDSRNFDKSIKEVNRTTSQMEKSFNNAKKALELSEKGVEDYSKAIKAGKGVIDSYKKKMEVLEKTYQDQEKNIKSLKEEHENLPKAIADAEKALNDLKASGTATTKEIEKQEKAVQTLKAKYDNFDTSLSNAVNALRNTENQIQQTSNKISKMENEVEDLSKELRLIDKGFNVDKLAKGFNDIAEGAEKAQEKIEGVKEKADKLSGAGALALGGMSASFLETDDNLGKLQASLGLTTEQLQELEIEAREVAKNGFDFSEVVDTFSEIKKVFGDTFKGDELKDFSENIMSMNGAFETDTTEVLKVVNQMMKQFGITGEESLDIITSGFQNGLNVSDDWMDTLWEYSTYFSDLGYTAEDTLNIINEGMKNGVFNTDKLADMVKEGKIRLVEMGDDAKGAVESIGLNAKAVQKAISGGGAEAKQQMQELTKKILEIEDPAKQAEVAIALFGTQMEDIGTDGLKALTGINGGLTDVKGSADKVNEAMGNTFSSKLTGAIENIKEPLAELGENVLLPMIKIIGDIAEKFNEWFGGLSDGEQKFILFGTIAVTALSPILGVASNVIGMFGGLSKGLGGLIKMFGGASGASGAGGLVTALGGLSSLAIPVAIGAIVGLLAMLGENESMLLKLQEKWGGFGTVVSGISEFISGSVQLTFGSILNMLTLVFDVIAAIIDGKGNLTIKDAWDRYNAKQELSLEEGYGKLALSTTRGMANLRYLTDTELNAINSSFDTLLSQVPLISDGKYSEASTNMASSLSTMSSNQLLALTNLNDTTRMLFTDIKEGMSIDEIIPVLTSNFETMNTAGKLNIEDLQSSITNGMDTVKSQLDVKSAEGAGAVATNMAEAQSTIDTATDNMVSNATINMANVAGAFIDESGKIPEEIQSNMDASTKTITTTMENMSNNVSKSFDNLTTKSTESLQKIVDKSKDVENTFNNTKSVVSNFASSVSSSIGSASRSIISDWNRVISTLSRSVTGSVTVNRTVRESIKPVALNSVMDDAVRAISPEAISTMNYSGRAYQPATMVSTSNKKVEASNNDMVGELKQQNSVLTKILEVILSEREINVETAINIDGRAVAKSTARYMESEINTINRRKSRLGGAF